MQDEILQMVKRFVGSQKADDQMTVYHLLFGYAKLLSMKTAVLKSMFSDDSADMKIKKMHSMLEREEIDILLMKQSFSMIVSNLNREQLERTAGNVLKDGYAEENAEMLLEKLLNLKLPEMNLVKKGRSITDTLTYIEEHPKEPAVVKSEKTPEKKEEKQAEAKPEKQAEVKATEAASAAEAAGAEASLEEQADGKGSFHELIAKSKTLYANLLGRVKGQDEAVRTFTEGYFQSEVFRSREHGKRPSAVFLFAGPPGVGKTFLAESAAEYLDLPHARFNMSEYCDSLSTSIFAGTEKKYNGAKKGTVTGFAEENPRSVLIFDEIEKAHLNVIYLFLQILDGGVLTDSYSEKPVSFRDTILIFTTNVGRSLYENDMDSNLSLLPRSVVIDAIRNEKGRNGGPAFPAAICSRFSAGNVVMFNHLGVHHLISIVQDKFEGTSQMALDQYGYSLVIDPRLATVLLFNQSSSLDARTASSQSVILIKNELYEYARHLSSTQKALQDIERFVFEVAVPQEKNEIRDLFVREEKSEILIFTAGKQGEEPEHDKLALKTAGSLEEAENCLKKTEYDFVLIDLLQGGGAAEEGVLSLDDRQTPGIRFFAWIREHMPHMPVYLLDDSGIDLEDKATFMQRGARGFLAGQDRDQLLRELVRISDDVYLQKKTGELSSRGKMLGYDTAQILSADGRTARIRFYNFRIRTAANAEARQLMLSDNSRPAERFGDIIGAENAKEELKYFVDYMRAPKKYRGDGVKLPKGILLYGPPGTGKTMLAKAIAGEANVSFFPVTAAGFLDKYIGEGERKIRELFAVAKSYAPSIIFIDEIDAIGKERTGSTSTHHTETLLNTLLTEMDGFETDQKKPVFVLAATNYDLDGSKSGKQSSIDPALLRRFDNRIYVDLPNENERYEYMMRLLKKRKIETVSETAVKNIAQRTTGESLAVLQNVLALGVRNAARAGSNLNDEILLNAFEEFQYGEKHTWNEEYYRSVAVHESGHALLNWLSGETPSFVTIVSRGNFGGYMQGANQEKTPNYSREQMIWKIRTCLAGRAAETVFFGAKEGINTGASSDLQAATNYALNMIGRYGMGKDSLLSFDPGRMLSTPRGESFLSEADELLKQEMQETEKLIEDHRFLIEALSQKLLEKNQLMSEEIAEILNKNEN